MRLMNEGDSDLEISSAEPVINLGPTNDPIAGEQAVGARIEITAPSASDIHTGKSAAARLNRVPKAGSDF